MQRCHGRLLLSDLPWTYLARYVTTRTSLARLFQDRFLEIYGPSLLGHVVELGGEKEHDHGRFFSSAESFTCTNIARSCDHHLDLTKMTGIADESIDGYVCVSVLEHVLDFHAGLSEIRRTLRPRGKLLLAVPFCFPDHDEVDHWRFAKDSLPTLLTGFRILAFVHLGATLSSVANALQRPKGRLRGRWLVYKLIGLVAAILARFLDTPDGTPIAYGVYAEKELATKSPKHPAS